MGVKSISAGTDALVMDASDHVATVIRDVAAGEAVTFVWKGEQRRVVAASAIPFGHKVAITPIQAGEPVRKYGEVIGAATSSIEAGEHVHVHNVEGIRGRGDIAGTAAGIGKEAHS